MLSIRRLFIIILFLSIFSMAVRETLDPDMWWHLRTGEAILQEGNPDADIFSYTVPENDWITHAWLSEVIMWIGYRISGIAGLILFFAAVITSAFWMLYQRSNGKPYVAAFLTLLTAISTAPFWGVRPQMFNLFFGAGFIYLIEGYRQGQIRKRTLWLLPLGTLIWANLHSGYLLGVVILLTYAAGDTLSLLFTRRTESFLNWESVRWFFLMAIISFLAAALNPNGPVLWVYPFWTLGSNAMQRYILEWHSPDFHQAIFWPFAFMLFVSVISLIASRRKPSLTELLLLFGTASAGLMSVRNIPIFAIVTLPIISRHALSALDGTRVYPFLSGQQRSTNASGFVTLNWIILFLMLATAGVWVGTKIQENEAAIMAQYPVSAVDYLEETGQIDRPIYNSYNWGGYLIWRGVPVFVDGRADVYGDEFLHNYRLTYDLSDRWQEPLDQYGVELVLMESGSPLSNLLKASSGWQSTYQDDVAVIFSREVE